MLALVGSEPDRLCLQIVCRADEAHGLAFRSHQNGMRGGLGALPFHSPQQRAVADSSRTKNNIFAVGLVVGRKDPLEIFFAAIIHQFLSFLLVSRSPSA